VNPCAVTVAMRSDLTNKDKKERHETVFPKDKKKAFDLDVEMVTTSWQ